MPADTLAAWATLVGTHALGVFLALLIVLLLLVAGGSWLLRSHLLPRAQSRLGPLALVPLSAAIGFALVLGAAALFAEIAEHLGPDATMSRADEALTAAIRAHVSPATLSVFAVLTHFGDVITLSLLGTVVALLLWWQRQRSLALGWVLALGGNALLNPALKRVFERVRPVHDHSLVNELGWSFPSGHTSSATVAYGMLAYVALRTLPAAWHGPVALAAAALAFTVGCSRVFLQVHFASDVVAGFASGAAWLTVCIVSVELARVYRRRA
jgi:membrane-associated phospholipid phosphatase